MAFGGGQDKIEIVVEVDNKGAVKGLNEVESAVKGIDDASSKGGGLSSLSTKLAAAGVAAISVTAAIAGVKAVLGALDEGSRINDLSNAFQSLSAQAGISSEKLRKDFGDALGGTITQVELFRRSNELMIAGVDPTKFDELADAARALADATGKELSPVLDTLSQDLIKGTDRGSKLLGVQVDMKAANEAYAASIGTTIDKLTEAQQVEAGREALLEALQRKTDELGKSTNDGADNLKVLSSAVADFKDQLSAAIAKSPELNELIKSIADFAHNTDFTPLINGIAGTVNAISKLLSYLPSVENFTDTVRVLTKVMSGVPLGVAEQVVALEKLEVALDKTSRAQNEAGAEAIKASIATKKKAEIDTEEAKVIAQWKEEEKKLQAELKKTTAASGEHAKATKQASVAVKDADAQVVAYKDHLKELAEEAKKLKEATEFSSLNLGKALNEAFGSFGLSDEALGTLAQSLGDSVARGLEDGFNRQSVVDAAKSAGDALGAYFGVPFAGTLAGLWADAITKVGKSSESSQSGITEMIDLIFPGIGTALDKMLGGMFSDDAKTRARKAADSFFADVFKDLQFSGNQDPTKGIFAGLSPEAQAQYQAAGDALSAMLGITADKALNLGVVLANNNLTLSDLPALIQASGASFDSLSEAMYTAFYNGTLSVLELQDKLEQLYGIVNGTTAFANLGAAVQAAFTEDGRTLLNAIKNIGVQAQATGVTLGQMPDILVNKFGIAASQVTQLMAAMAAAGIKSLADLANASQSTLTAVAANIQQAQQGITPDNKAVIPQTPSAPSGGGGGGGGSRAAPRISTPRATTTRTKTDPNDKIRQEILRTFNQVQSSAIGKEFDAKVASGAISDAEYAAGIQTLVDQARKLNKDIEDAQKKYLDDVRTKSKNTSKDLQKLEKLKTELETALKGSGTTAAKDQTDLQRLDLFAQKFAGNVELIKIAAAGLKISFKSLKDEALQAFQAGTKTFAEANQALQDSTGIAGKHGAVGEAVGNFLKDGTRGGIFSERDLKAIATEAKELGASTLDDVSQAMLGQGVDPAVVQKLFIGFKNNGINAISDLENITTEKVIQLGASYQDLALPFEETTTSMRDQLTELDKLLNQPRKMTVDLDAVISPLLRQILELTGTPIAPGGTTTPAPGPGVPTATKGSKHKNKVAGKGLFRIMGGANKGQTTKDQYSYY